MCRRIFCFISLLWLLPACTQQPGPPAGSTGTSGVHDTLLTINQKSVEFEYQLIEDFIARYQWQMQQTGTGLRYRITRQGYGPNLKNGQRIGVAYTMRLLSGLTLKTAGRESPLVFTLGRGEVIPGLDEGLLLLKRGSHANIILPSHLAYGVAGEPGLIPPRASLVFDIEIVDVQ